MAASKVVAFVKFFSDESHADQFIKGILYMRRLRYFQRLEAPENDDGRADAHEAPVSWHQPDRIELVLDFPGFEPIKIDKTIWLGHYLSHAISTPICTCFAYLLCQFLIHPFCKAITTKFKLNCRRPFSSMRVV
jgi:hypothetical protein